MPGFAEFYVRWAQLKGWTVPLFHFVMCDWLENYGSLGLLMVFRGAGKSTMLAVYEAWRLYINPKWRMLNWSADDKLAVKLTRDVRDVLTRHPWTQGMLQGKPSEHQFWVVGADDERNASVSAFGILSNATGSHADEVINDDVEVPKNIGTQDTRDKLRHRLGESTFILVPGGRELYVGTPHTFDSIYTEIEEKGASVLKIPLFKFNQRETDAANLRTLPLQIPSDDLIVISGRDVLEPGINYTIEDDAVEFTKPMNGMIDMYAGNMWPEHFTREHIELCRRKAVSQNDWDSQFQLQAKPIHDIRLDPEKLRHYEVEPVFGYANKVLFAQLGKIRLSSVRTYWDISLGKIKSDASALCVLFGDDLGNLYWHLAKALTGEIDAQCEQLREVVTALKLPNVMIETNGPGGFVPAIARKALAGTGCSVTPHFVAGAQGSKNKRILDAIEPALSGRFLWCHTSVADSGALTQIRDFNPGTTDQPDDFLDSLAGCITASPVKIGRHTKQAPTDVFRPQFGNFQVGIKQ